MRKNLIKIVSAVFCIMQLSACATQKRTLYFQGIDEQNQTALAKNAVVFRIEPNDVLNIEVILPKDMEVAALESALSNSAGSVNVFNSEQRGISTNRENMMMFGYLVDSNGEIDFPTLGKVKLAGLTREEAVKLLTARISETKNDPIVKVRYLNKKISVLGEVTNPGQISLTTDKLSIIDAIALAGDLRIQGRRKDVLVVRQVNGQIQHERLDLTSKNVFNSPYFWLAPEDIVYVSPNRARTMSGEWAVATYALSGISLLLALYNLFK